MGWVVCTYEMDGWMNEYTLRFFVVFGRVRLVSCEAPGAVASTSLVVVFFLCFVLSWWLSFRPEKIEGSGNFVQFTYLMGGSHGMCESPVAFFMFFSVLVVIAQSSAKA